MPVVSSADAATPERLTPVVRSAAQTRLLVAALDLFAEPGVSATSLQMIADAIGVTKAAVYHQFNTKDEIVLAVTEREMVRIQSALDGAEAENQPQAREALLDWVIELAVQRRRLVSVLQFDPVIIRLLGAHEPFQLLMDRLYTVLIGDGVDAEARVRAAMLSSAIGGTVASPLVHDLDDATLTAQLTALSRRILNMPQSN